MSKYFLLSLLFLSIATCLYGQASNHYVIKAKLDPQSGRLSATAQIRLLDTSLTDTLRFYLLADLHIESFEVQNGKLLAIKTDTSKTYLHTIEVLRKNSRQPVIINSAYSGTINNKHITFGVGCVTPEWTELSDYVKWVPLELHNPLFTYQINMQVSNQYKVSGYGTTRKVAPGVWNISNNSPSYRLGVFLSNNWYRKTIKEGNLTINIHCVKGPDTLTDYLISSIPKLVKLYNESFGEGTGTFNLFFRNKDLPVNYTSWAYAATGFVSLYNIQNKPTLFLTLAHELGHNWWHKGKLGTPDEFLSESFAEYAALMAFRQYYPEKFLKRYSSFESKSKSIPAITALPQYSDDRYNILYVKGSTLLLHLENQIGEERFKAFLKEAKHKSIDTVPELLHLLEEMNGKEVMLEFQTALNN